MEKTKVADDTPVAKNDGVRVKIASKMYPSFVCRRGFAFLERVGPLRITVVPVRLASDDWYATRPLLVIVVVVAGSLVYAAKFYV